MQKSMFPEKKSTLLYRGGGGGGGVVDIGVNPNIFRKNTDKVYERFVF